MVKELKNIDEVETGTVIVDVWAPWCGPCIAMAPIFETLSDSFDAIDFMKCNIDDIPGFGAAYNIKTIPTFIIFKDGVVVEKIIGGVTKSLLEKKLQNV